MVVRNLKHNGCDELDGNLTKHERDFKIKAFLFLDIIEVVSKSLDFHYRRYSKKYSRFELIRRHQSNDDMLGQCWNWIRTGSKTVGNAFPSRQNTATNTNMGFVTDGQPRQTLVARDVWLLPLLSNIVFWWNCCARETESSVLLVKYRNLS